MYFWEEKNRCARQTLDDNGHAHVDHLTTITIGLNIPFEEFIDV
jgi:hypothetical protein